MRAARFKFQEQSAYYHLLNRVAGTKDDLPFGDAEKAEFVRRLKRLSRFYTIDIIAYCVMSNHFHLVVHVPTKKLTAAEAAARYEAFYDGKRLLAPDSPQASEMAERMRDISWLMRDLQQQFTTWYNRTRAVRRRGTLWADRFKSVILDGQSALVSCVKYVLLNPVRAKLVDDPMDYWFSNWGEANGSGRPGLPAFYKHIRRSLGENGRGRSNADIDTYMRGELARTIALEAGVGSHDELQEAIQAAEAGSEIFVTAKRRVRYWSDGAIVGSRLFVLNLSAQFEGKERAGRRRLGKGKAEDGSLMFALRQLRDVGG